MGENDAIIIERWVRHRDAEAFRELVVRYSAMVFATCRRVLGNASDAEEVAQECFEALAQVQRVPVGYVGPWLHRVAVNQSLNRIRGERRRKHREELYAASQPLVARSEWDDIYPFVDEAIAALPDELREPIVAHFLEGRTHAEVAARLGISRQAVSYRLDRGTDRIRNSLKKRGIQIAATSLAALMAEASANAVPTALVSTLGKIALSGAIPGSSNITATTVMAGGTLLMKKAILAIVTVLLVAATTYFFAIQETLPVARPMDNPRYKKIAQTPGVIDSPASSAAANREPADSSFAGDTHKGAMTGSVSEEKTGLPVPGVNIICEASGTEVLRRRLVETDAQGQFRMDDLAPGSYRVSISKAEFWVGTTENSWISVTIKPGLLLENVDFRTKALRGISGRVTDTSGRPLPNVAIMCVLNHSGRSTVTDQNGEYHVDNLPDDVYSVCVFAIDGKRIDGRNIDGGIIDEVPAGSEGIDFRIELGERAAIDGTVVNDESNAPVTQFELLALDGQQYNQPWDTQQFDAHQDANGVFHLKDLLPGPITLVARAPGFSETPLTLTEVAGGSVLREVTIRLMKGMDVEGIVQDRQENPIANAKIYGGGLQDNLQSGRNPIARSKTDGHFYASNVPSATGELTAIANGYAPHAATLDAGNTGKPVVIVLSSGGAIRGHVYYDGRPWPNQDVSIAVPRADGSNAVRSDTNGAFRFDRLPAGSVMLHARVPLQPGDTSGKIRTMTLAATVVDDTDSKVDFNFSPLLASLEGTVSANGQPIASVQLVLSVTDEFASQEFTSASDMQGAYSFAALPAGAATLEIHHGPNEGSTSVELQLQPGVVTTKNVNLSTGATLSGTVFGLADGEQAIVLLIDGDAPQRTTDIRTYMHELTRQLRARVEVHPTGSYQLTGLQPGAYTLIAYAGIGSNLTNAREVTASMDIVEGDNVQDISFLY